MVFKCIEFPGHEFETQTEMFLMLKKHEDKIIELKRAQTFKSCEKNQISYLNLDMSKVSAAFKTDFEVKADYIYPVISTTRYMDSHKDVHFDGCFNRTIGSQQGKVYYALDHELKYNSILAWQKDVRMFKAMIDWTAVGKSYPGQTEGLVFEIEKSKITNKQVLNDIENHSSAFENSIRMNYGKVVLGINSTEKEFVVNKAYFDSRINTIANKDQVIEDGYFYGVEELKINKEGSLVVAGGSNDATSIITLELAKSTSEIVTPANSLYDTLLLKSVWDSFLIN